MFVVLSLVLCSKLTPKVNCGSSRDLNINYMYNKIYRYYDQGSNKNLNSHFTIMEGFIPYNLIIVLKKKKKKGKKRERERIRLNGRLVGAIGAQLGPIWTVSTSATVIKLETGKRRQTTQSQLIPQNFSNHNATNKTTP